MKKFKDGNLGRAVARTTHHSGATYCGCYTPSEALALTKAGAKFDNSPMYQWLIDHQRKGLTPRTWLYFTPRAALQAALFEHQTTRRHVA